MDFNDFVFPFPEASYNANSFENLLWIDREKKKKQVYSKEKRTRKGTIRVVLRSKNENPGKKILVKKSSQ